MLTAKAAFDNAIDANPLYDIDVYIIAAFAIFIDATPSRLILRILNIIIDTINSKLSIG